MKGQEAFLLFKKGHPVFKKPDDLFPCNKISYAYSLLFAPRLLHFDSHRTYCIYIFFCALCL